MAKRQQLALELKALSKLREDPDNARDHDPEELARAFKRFGFNDPIEIDSVDGMIAAGHGRKQTLEMMKASGEEPPDNILQDESGEWLVPCVIGIRSKSKKEARAYRIANNKQGEHGGWKDGALAAVLVSLKEEGGLEGTGFTDRELRQITGRLNPPSPDKLPARQRTASDKIECPKCGHEFKPE